jgi:hypothetical protein
VLRIRDVYPGSRILIFTHPRSKNSNKREGRKKFFVIPSFHKIVNYFIFEMLKKKIWANFQRIIELYYTQKIVPKLSKLWVWDPGNTYFGSLVQGTNALDPDPQHWLVPKSKERW